MTVFEQLEGRLAASVRAGAIDPEHQPAQTTPRRRRWRRAPVIACIAGLAVAGGALAGTGVLPIGSPLDEPPPPVLPGDSPVLVEGQTRVLALRVPDPAGGPPWALRVFRTDRGASCLQVGQVYRGRFGTVTADAAGVQTFRPLKALPGSNSLCGGVERDGIPVLRGLRKVVSVGGSADTRRCGGRPCPITDVRVLRYGTLGPQARSATFIDAAGRRATSMRVTPKTGGAYLFVVPVPAAPYQRADQQQQQFTAAFERALRDARAQGLGERAAYAEASRQVAGVIRAMRRQPTARVDLRPRDGVDAVFADGTRLRVAGRGRTAGPLPGVAPRVRTLPAVAAPLRVTTFGTGARRRFVVAFLAPVAIRRFDRHYALAVQGPTGSACTRRSQGAYDFTTRRIDRGDPVRFRVTPRSAGYRRTTWCPGAFAIRVTYRTPGAPAGGLEVGTHRFLVAAR